MFIFWIVRVRCSVLLDSLRACKHHLCSSQQLPDPAYYSCNLTNEWTLTYISGHSMNLKRSLPTKFRPSFGVPSDIPGHFGASRSMVYGLSKIYAGRWNFNPSSIGAIGNILWTDRCSEGLRQYALAREMNASLKGFVVCGANTYENVENEVQHPSFGFYASRSLSVAEHNSLSSSSARFRIRVLVAGVDTDFFKPSMNRDSRKIVIYVKGVTIQSGIVPEVRNALASLGYRALLLVYGNYSISEFRAALDGAVAAVFLTRTESQGIALSETWAMDVPTLVYTNGFTYPHDVFGRLWLHQNPAPYLNYLNGAWWNSLSGLLKILGRIDLHHFQPRNYVLTCMTDEIATLNALRAVQCEWNRRYSHTLASGTRK